MIIEVVSELELGGSKHKTCSQPSRYYKMPLSTEEYDKLSTEEREKYDAGERQREREEQAGARDQH